MEKGSRERFVPSDKRTNGMSWDGQTAALKQNIFFSLEGVSGEESKLEYRGP